jgi:hypothetical protein
LGGVLGVRAASKPVEGDAVHHIQIALQIAAQFRYIDNRTTSSILWVFYEPTRKDDFERIISGYKVQCKLEKRGALATKNAPAWRVMFT